jgi:site-specific recombinase XerD
MATRTALVSNGWKKKPRRRFLPETLTDVEVPALLETCPRSATGIRNQVLIATLYRAGLRISEALDLYPPPPATCRGGKQAC